MKDTSKYTIYLTNKGAQLQPIAFASRVCTEMDSKLNSFVGKIAAGHCAISQNHKYLWGAYFFWLCDCITIKEVFDYDGDIILVIRWVQELLGYNFKVLHRSNEMMVYVDDLTHRFGSLIARHLHIVAILHKRDKEMRPSAYLESTFIEYKVENNISIPLPT